ncbi:hypothetical protein ONZ45_g10853 [Pleurotus djamor]|nr:hypothetical protein ONZ45_g10853 [Pleurotus djamor]
MSVNYTTYDLRLERDIITPRSRPDIMTLKQTFLNTSNDYPFSYAHVLGIFHVNVTLLTPPATTTSYDVLWVRWFRIDRAGTAKNLPRLAFLDGPDAMGFLNPDDVIRACHVIPAFAFGPSEDTLGKSLARQTFHGDILSREYKWPDDDNIEEDDYQFYYVNIFADRDMYMRHRGGGVGHFKVKEVDTLEESGDIMDEPTYNYGETDSESRSSSTPKSDTNIDDEEEESDWSSTSSVANIDSDDDNLDIGQSGSEGMESDLDSGLDEPDEAALGFYKVNARTVAKEWLATDEGKELRKEILTEADARDRLNQVKDDESAPTARALVEERLHSVGVEAELSARREMVLRMREKLWRAKRELRHMRYVALAAADNLHEALRFKKRPVPATAAKVIRDLRKGVTFGRGKEANFDWAEVEDSNVDLEELAEGVSSDEDCMSDVSWGSGEEVVQI